MHVNSAPSPTWTGLSSGTSATVIYSEITLKQQLFKWLGRSYFSLTRILKGVYSSDHCTVYDRGLGIYVSKIYWHRLHAFVKCKYTPDTSLTCANCTTATSIAEDT